MPRAHALLAGLFDYAGLFPPASLPLGETLTRYMAHRVSRDGWMLGRLVVPAADLDAVSALASHLPTGRGADPLRICAVSSDIGADLLRVDDFNRRHADPSHGAATVDVIESKVGSADDVRGLRAWAARGLDVHCEVPLGRALDPLLDAVAHAGLHAKIRTVGVSPAGAPAAEDVAAFLCGCVARGVVAKATAGLHHAVTGRHSLGPADGADTTMFGYLNVVLGAGIAEGAGRAAVQSAEVSATVARLLSVTSTPSWLGHAQVDWRGPRGPIIEGPLEQFAVAGRAVIRSIGTCSFTEPVADARRIGLIA